MTRRAAALALVLTTICVGWTSPALGTGHGASGHASASAHGATSRGAMAQPSASHPPGAGMVVTRRAPPFRQVPPQFRHAPTGSAIIVDRTPIFFVQPFFFEHRVFAFGEPLFLGGSPIVIMDAPFFCYLDGLGFTDQAAFAQHLHDAHGIPLDRALSFCEPVGGRYVFFGF